MLKNSRIKKNNKDLLDLTNQMLLANNSLNNKNKPLHKMDLKANNNNKNNLIAKQLEEILEITLYTRGCRTRRAGRTSWTCWSTTTSESSKPWLRRNSSRNSWKRSKNKRQIPPLLMIVNLMNKSNQNNNNRKNEITFNIKFIMKKSKVRNELSINV